MKFLRLIGQQIHMIENVWILVKAKMRDTRPNNADGLITAIKAIWAFITLQHNQRLITSMPRSIYAVNHAKRDPMKS